MLQGKYKELFEKFVRTSQFPYSTNYVNDEDDIDYVGQYEDDDEAAHFLEQIAILSQQTGVPLQLDREFVMSMYAYCLSHGKEYHHKLGVIAQHTGVEIDQEFIQIHILDNKDFSKAVPFGITSEQLDEHFSNPEHNSLEEYKRIYSVFGCYEYYQEVLTTLQKAGTTDAKKRTIELLTTMGLRDKPNNERYSAIKEKNSRI
ncbi:MAG: hypothetical protein UZ21_OP11001000453 [Microgenomates bacterium OLB22]|nr:MAG: hypothetical protein UZ21_OP11001000453 [Microgenomates bacterium OLB22]